MEKREAKKRLKKLAEQEFPDIDKNMWAYEIIEYLDGSWIVRYFHTTKYHDRYIIELKSDKKMVQIYVRQKPVYEQPNIRRVRI